MQCQRLFQVEGPTHWEGAVLLSCCAGKRDDKETLLSRVERAMTQNTQVVQQSKSCSLSDNNFLTKLGFPLNLPTHVNTLNQALQGKTTTACFMHWKVQEFLLQCNCLHFQQLNSLMESGKMQQDNIPVSSFTATLDALLQEFTGRFNDSASTEACCFTSSRRPNEIGDTETDEQLLIRKSLKKKETL